jgi:hypothetical protein
MNYAMTTTDDHGTDIPLMFVVFVPAWSDSIGYKTLESSPYIVQHILLSQKNDVHYYAEGTQHRRRVAANGNDCGISGHRIASFDTSVFYLQNDAAKVQWPLRDDDKMMLKTAFAMNSADEKEYTYRGDKRSQVKVPQAEGSSAFHRSTKRSQTTSSSSKRQLEAKKTAVKEQGSLKKNKLVSGGQDELGILKGILDDGSIRGDASTIDASRGEVHKAKSNKGVRRRRR